MQSHSTQKMLKKIKQIFSKPISPKSELSLIEKLPTFILSRIIDLAAAQTIRDPETMQIYFLRENKCLKWSQVSKTFRKAFDNSHFGKENFCIKRLNAFILQTYPRLKKELNKKKFETTLFKISLKIHENPSQLLELFQKINNHKNIIIQKIVPHYHTLYPLTISQLNPILKLCSQIKVFKCYAIQISSEKSTLDFSHCKNLEKISLGVLKDTEIIFPPNIREFTYQNASSPSFKFPSTIKKLTCNSLDTPLDLSNTPSLTDIAIYNLTTPHLLILPKTVEKFASSNLKNYLNLSNYSNLSEVTIWSSDFLRPNLTHYFPTLPQNIKKFSYTNENLKKNFDFSDFPLLTSLTIRYIPKNTTIKFPLNLQHFTCDSVKTQLDFSQCHKLSTLTISNFFNSPYIRCYQQCDLFPILPPNIKKFIYPNKSNQAVFNFSEFDSLTSLEISQLLQPTTIHLPHNLEEFTCNILKTNIDFSHCLSLKKLTLHHIGTSVKIKFPPNLKSFTCNSVESHINLSICPFLEEAIIKHNTVTITLHKNTRLYR